MGHYLDLAERIKRELTMDKLVPHHTGRKPIRCPLPGHADKNGSFIVYSETNSWWCPSHQTTPCGGSPIDFIMADKGLDFKGAVRYAAELMHLDLAPPTEEERAVEEAKHKREETLSVLARYAHGQLMADTEPARQARAYLEGRGFVVELLKEHVVGLVNLAKVYQVRATHPILGEFNQADFEEAGLRTERGGLLFRDTRISFPLLKRHRATGMSFRALPDSEDRRKFVHLAGQAAGLWNVDALHNPERKLVLAEGIPDALQVDTWGIPAVGNLGLEVAKNAHLFAHLKDVTLVWDNDAAGRGRVVRSARTIQAALRDGEVRILHMPGEKDINDWARAGGTKEEFQALLDGAPDLIEYQIEQLPDVKAGGKMRREDQAAVQDVLESMTALSELRQAVYLDLLKKRCGLQMGSLRASLKEIKSTQAERARAQEAVVQMETSAASKLIFEDTLPYIASLSFTTERT
ncbi:MAG: toprim domain-containing protein [bacterium]|nr:toprim domain-containing protein [bacterium]